VAGKCVPSNLLARYLGTNKPILNSTAGFILPSHFPRGFETKIQPAEGIPLQNFQSISCTKCKLRWTDVTSSLPLYISPVTENQWN